MQEYADTARKVLKKGHPDRAIAYALVSIAESLKGINEKLDKVMNDKNN